VTRFLSSGISDWDAYAQAYKSRAIQQQVRRLDLTRGKRALCLMDVVCVLSDFDACMNRITTLFNITKSSSMLVESLDRHQTPTRPKTISHDALKLIESRNTLDVKLYEWANVHCKYGQCKCGNIPTPDTSDTSLATYIFSLERT